MSLILDALKKLERDREAREPNVLVVGSVPWGTRARSRLPLAVVGIAILALLAVALWPWSRTPRPAGAAPSPAAPSPAPSAAPGPPLVPALASAAPGAAFAAPEPRRPSLPSARSQAQSARPAEGAASPGEADAARRSPAGTEDLRLTAISQRDGRPVALINDRLVFEGDGFDGVKVLRIGEAEVEVEVNGKRRVLRF